MAPTPECTTFAVGGRRTATGGVLFGQNVDLAPFVEEFGVVVRQYPKGAPACLMYTSAGLVGHNGLNEAGVGICANFVNDPSGWGEGLPRYLLSRLALREDNAEAALAAALRPPRAASRNLLLADRQRHLHRRGVPQDDGGRDPRRGRHAGPRQSSRGARTSARSRRPARTRSAAAAGCRR